MKNKVIPFVVLAVFLCIGIAFYSSAESEAPSPTPEATPASTPKVITTPGGIKMVKIPAGKFLMGSPGDEPGRERYETWHWVTISRPFLMGITEVTQGQWKKVMGNNPSRFKNCGDGCPVEEVSWNDVIEFCNLLSDREGLSKCYRGNGLDVQWNISCMGYRLPTEAEWEYAARAGSTTAFASGSIRELECGHDPNLDQMGWYCGNSSVSYSDCDDRSRIYGGTGECAGTHPVGRKQANAWNLYDMHGNVSEWVWDWYYRNYPSGSVTDPVGRSSGTFRVVRGGSWRYSACSCRSASRSHSFYSVSQRQDRGYRNINLGFRIARSTQSAPDPTPVTPTPKPVTPQSQTAGMALIPAGWFYMGNIGGIPIMPMFGEERQRLLNEGLPRRRVYLDAFYMDIHEVTVAEYAECWNAGACSVTQDRNKRKFCNWGYNDRDDHPINCVYDYQAEDYCKWVGKRLPTEAEWEKAARGGLKGKLFPWGDAWATCDYAVISDGADGCGKKRTWPVMSKPLGKNGYGLYDMAGNVSEWCQDYYDENWYSRMPDRNPVNRNPFTSPFSVYQVVRGGSWNSPPWNVRASSRGAMGGIEWSIYVGFRCVRETE